MTDPERQDSEAAAAGQPLLRFGPGSWLALLCLLLNLAFLLRIGLWSLRSWGLLQP